MSVIPKTQNPKAAAKLEKKMKECNFSILKMGVCAFLRPSAAHVREMSIFAPVKYNLENLYLL
jgi:hypothetical protein